MRLTITLCAFILLFTSLSAHAADVGLYVERLKDPNVIRCPYCNKPIVPGKIHENAESLLSTEFGGALGEKGIAYTQALGQNRYLNVFVYRFQEREGGNFSVVKPASVGFHVHLFEGSRLAEVFVFDETQQPLSDNVFRFFTFLRRGGKWITAGELAREGVEKAVDSFTDTLREAPEGP